MPFAFIARRILFAIPTIVGISLVAFSLSYLAPGDPALAVLGLDAEGDITFKKADIERVRKEMGFDKPLLVQYLKWAKGLLHGNLGKSYVQPYPVSKLIADALPTTLSLMFGTMALAALIGIPLGVISAIKQNAVTDYIARILAITGVSMPVFWEALILILIFAFIYPILPMHGGVQEHGWRAAVLPVAAIATHPAALIARMTRSSMLEVLTENYVRTAVAKGLTSRRVTLVHALRNALNPVITVIGFQFGNLIGGAVVVEAIFAMPGMGHLLINSIYAKDLVTIQGIVLVISLVFVAANLTVDILYSVLDPRIRY
ncbi:MAG: ABC transporter permease [Deltaproteobacteria bacterium]|nr:ABC transporter permease [Deltaproteobacteria bacterium]